MLVVANSEGGTGRLWPVDLSEPAQPQLGPMLRQFWGTGAITSAGQRLVLGTATGVAVSDDNGTTWRESRQGLEQVTVSVDPLEEPIPEAERARSISAVAIVPDSPDHLFAGTRGGLYASINGGQTWHKITAMSGPVSKLVLTADASQLFVQTESGVFIIAIATAGA